MGTIVQLIREGTITQGLLALVIWGAIVFQVLNNVPVSDVLLLAGSTILGFFFGLAVPKPVKPASEESATWQDNTR